MATDARVRHELDQALRSGPFAAALHLAIEASGLTLEEIRDWLGERGAHLSIATLSYWRRGRSRPEREASLVAVRLLEDLLRLPDNALVSLLGPRRARGRWVGHVPGSVAPQLLFADFRPEEMLNTVGVPAHGRLRRVSVQVTVDLDAEQMVERIRVRELVRAAADRVSRMAVMYYAEERPDLPPALIAVQNARVGLVETDRTVGLVVAELILDRVLDAGEPALVEYEWRFAPGTHMVNYEHRFLEPVKEYVLQTRFAAGAVPAHCHRYDRRTSAAPEGNRAELWIGGSGSALVAETDVPAGIVGMRWNWSQQYCGEL